MVLHSLKNMIEKYPYFLDKRPSSNFYKITKTYNENFKLIYNDLFRVYESFHLNKNILVWKEQSAPYEYCVNFVANYPLLKKVSVYKNNYLIYKEEYSEKDNVDSFKYTYCVKYTKSNMRMLNAYRCNNPDCGNIYFDDELPSDCAFCGNDTYVQVDVYECSECGEVYFGQEKLTDCTLHNHTNSLVPVNVYKCRNCGQIYFGEVPPDECKYCFEDENNTIHTKGVEEIISPLHYNDSSIIVTDNSVDYTEYGDNTLKVYVKNEKGNPLSDIVVSLSYDYNEYQGVTDENGLCVIHNIVDGEYNLNINHVGYVDDGKLLFIDEDLVISRTLEKVENDVEDIVSYDVEIPEIPNDSFIITVETWEEYEIIKGFPENDVYMDDVFDHDYSLDEIGALNRIPRKRYEVITDSEKYPFTEPPFNNRETEDDYHYMKRMLEYNVRLWGNIELLYDLGYLSLEEYNYYRDNPELVSNDFNPVTLELWKIYGINSELINRERYLLKVFDEQRHPFDDETELVKCWTPQKWEHKDKFCDGSSTLGEYFFVTANTVRPIRWENVDFSFSVLNSLAEPIEEDYTVDIYKVVDGEEILIREGLHDDKYRISYKSIDVGKPTVFRFNAKYSNGDKLGITDIVINARTEPDWYVDEESTKDYEDGSKEYPFKTLQKALNKVNGSLNLISLKGNIHLKEPLIINQNTIIIGENSYTDEDDKSTRYVPRIFQEGIEKINDTTLRFRRDFFKITGNKNCKLTLSNLRLVSGQLNSYIGINSWINNNTDLDSYETVIIHGGAINLSVSYNQDQYYPFDFVKGTVNLSKTDDVVLPNNTIELYYNNKLVNSLITNEEGVVNFNFNLNEENVGLYHLNILNRSDVFFEQELSEKIYAFKTPQYANVHSDEDIEFIIKNCLVGDKFNLYLNDGTLVEEDLEISNEGDYTYALSGVPFGKYVLYTTVDNTFNGSVRDECIIESIFDIKDLPIKTFIKNLEFDESNGDLNYELFTLPENPTLNDLNGIVIDVKNLNEQKDMKVTYFTVPHDKIEDSTISYTDALVFQEAFCNLTFDDGVLKAEKLGKFW